MAPANWQEVRTPGTFHIGKAFSVQVQVGCDFKECFASPILRHSVCVELPPDRCLICLGGQQLGSGSGVGEVVAKNSRPAWPRATQTSNGVPERSR